MVSPVSLALAPQRPGRGLRAYAANVYRAVTSIFEGLVVTMSWMFRRPATIQYPDRIEKPVQEMLPEGWRGTLEVDLRRCTACLLCMRACPIGCITIEVQKNAETGGRELTRFDIDIGRCMYCGLCAEACNFDALSHTTEFETAVPNLAGLVLRFVKQPTPVAKVKPGEGPPRLPRGSVLPGVVPDYGRRCGKNRWRGRMAPAVASAPGAEDRSDA